jgi:pimeloyl-ACP methyl ester carboxylesterase
VRLIARRGVLAGGFACIAARAHAQTAPAAALVLHGKQGTPNFPALRAVASALERAGLRVAVPEMPWSRSRYLDGPPDKAFGEIADLIAGFKREGAAKIFLAGHSIGATAALGYATSRGGIDGLALLATGHVPTFYALGLGPINATVRDAILRARGLVATGKGETVEEFADNNQGEALRVRMRAADYLGYFDPGGAMDPQAQIARAPCAVLWAIGTRDVLYSSSRSLYFDRLPRDPRHAFFEADADHRGLPQVAAPATAAFFRSLSA